LDADTATALRFGIVQGRLIQCPPGCLQWFPQDRWRDEFALAADLGLDYIELIAETKHNPRNPLWSAVGRAEIKSLAARHGLSLHALCNDYTVGNALAGDGAVLKQSLDLVARGGELGMEKLVLPLFDASELTPANMDDYVGPIREIADAARDAGMTTCLETILTGSELIALLDKIGRPHVKAVYDTGNRVAFGHDLPGATASPTSTSRTRTRTTSTSCSAPGWSTSPTCSAPSTTSATPAPTPSKRSAAATRCAPPPST
jgi:hypothetical protein